MPYAVDDASFELLEKAAASAFATIVETETAGLHNRERKRDQLININNEPIVEKLEIYVVTFGRICLENCQARLVEEGV